MPSPLPLAYAEVQASKFAGAISLDELASMSQHDFDSHRFHNEEADPPSYIRSRMRHMAQGGGGGANRLAITVRHVLEVQGRVGG